MGLVIVGSAAAQFVADRREAPGRLERIAGRPFGRPGACHRPRSIGCGGPTIGNGVRGTLASKWLEALDQTLDGPAVGEVQGLIPLVDAARNASSPTRRS